MNWWKTANKHVNEASLPSGQGAADTDSGRFARYTDDEVRKILDRAYKAGAPQGIIDALETELDRREMEEDDPSGGDDEPNRSNTGYGIEELMRQAALRGRAENMSPAQLGAEIRRDGDFAVMTGASPLATVSDAELGQEAYDALRAYEERVAAIRERISTRARAVPHKMAEEHAKERKLAMTKIASSLRGQWWIVDGVAHRAGHDNMPAHGRWAIEMAEKEIAPAEMEIIGRHEKEMKALGMSMDDALARRLGGSPLWILESHVMDMGRTDEDRMDEEEMEKAGEMDEQRKRLVNVMMEEARAAVPKDLWKAAHSGSGYEATEWLMGRGGMTVSGVNIAMPSASFDSLRSLAKAMDAVVPDIDDESTVNIDVKSGSGTTHYEKVPWSVVRTGNTGALMGRGDR